MSRCINVEISNTAFDALTARAEHWVSGPEARLPSERVEDLFGSIALNDPTRADNER